MPLFNQLQYNKKCQFIPEKGSIVEFPERRIDQFEQLTVHKTYLCKHCISKNFQNRNQALVFKGFNLLNMIYLAALTALVAAGGVGLLSVVLKNRWPGKNKIKQALEAMKKEAAALSGDLVPIEAEELDAFSSRQQNSSLKKGLMTTAKGAFTTIFHEPVMAYNFKKYMGGDLRHNALMVIIIHGNEFTYWLQKSGTEIFIGDQRVGTLKKDNKLYGTKTKKVLAEIKPESNGLSSVMVYDKEVGSISSSNPTGEKELSNRAFEFVKDNLSREEKLLFLALSGYELVMRSIEAK